MKRREVETSDRIVGKLGAFQGLQHDMILEIRRRMDINAGNPLLWSRAHLDAAVEFLTNYRTPIHSAVEDLVIRLAR